MKKDSVVIIKGAKEKEMLSKEVLEQATKTLKERGLFFIQNKLDKNQLLEVAEVTTLLTKTYGRLDESLNLIDELPKASDRFNETHPKGAKLELIPYDFYNFDNDIQLLNMFTIGIKEPEGLRAIYFIHPDLFDVIEDENGDKKIRCYFIKDYIPYLELTIKNIEDLDEHNVFERMLK